MLDLTWRIPHNIEEFSEAAFQSWVELEAVGEGWRTYHTRDSRGSDKGFPDLCMARTGQLLFLELKKRGGRVSKEQREWIALLNTVPNVRAFILYANTEDALAVLEMLRRKFRGCV